ncbi:MAG: oligoendopeptidase F [Halanaerobiales bacterium]
MVKELPAREEISEDKKWNLKDIYSSVDVWEEDFEYVEKELLPRVQKYKDKLTESGETLKKGINLVMDIKEITSRLYAFAHMSKDVDTREQKYQSLYSRAQGLNNKIASYTSFIIPEILQMTTEELNDYLSNTKGLELYEHFLDDILRRKRHYLSPREEELLAMAGEVTQGPENIFAMLNNADIEFPVVVDENNEEVRITHGRFIKLLKSGERRVRKEVFDKFYSVYDNFNNTFASTLNTEIKGHIFNAKARKYESARKAALDEDNIPLEVYDNLIDSVHNNLKPMYKYLEIRKKMLDLDELHMYDIYVSLVKELDEKISFIQARQTILEALQHLGKNYLKNLEKGFNSGWIDIYENKGKRSGAYSSGCYGVHPYVLLNYQDNISNMFTLAHEMGHALHTYYSNKNQPFVYANYKIFVAEVASTLNESLLIHHLLDKTEDRKKRIYLINYYLEKFRGTVYRQTMFAEFENIIHQKSEEGEPLTSGKLNEIYYNLNKKYYGDNVVVDDKIALEWARIPHFYYNFYVYKYATGFSAAAALSQKILKEGEGAVDRYLDFLKSGDSEYPIKLLQKAGVDMTTTGPVNTALAVFSNLVDELEELTK